MIDSGKPVDAQGPPPGGPCVFRNAQAGDRAAVIALVFDTLRSYGIEPDPAGLDADVMCFGQPEDPMLSEFVADIAGRVVGSIALRDRSDGTGHVSKFFVETSARGRGIGRRLLAMAVGTAGDRGLRELDLDTRSQFEAAIHLYECTGWKRAPDPVGVCDRSYVLRLR